MSKRSRTRDWQKHHNTRDACGDALRPPAVIGNIDFAAGATVTVPPDTADWLVANGTAVIIDAPNAEEAATPKRRTPDR